MKFVDCTRPISVKSLAAGLLIVLFAIPSLAVAQVGGGCAGAIDVENNGTNFTGISVFSDYYKVDLPDSIRWTLNPKAGGELIVSTNQVRFGLTCSNNGDSVPCAVNDEQAGNPGVTPIVYTPLVGDPTGTCGATLASNVNGTLLFDLPSTELNQTGCTIEFETELQDIGGGGASGDLDPQFITSSVAYTGTCENGSLQGNAAGSIAVEVWDPEIDVTKTGPELAKKGDNIQYEIGCSVVRDPEAIDVCTGNDPLLGGDLGVFDCVNGETRTFPYTVKDDDPNPLPNEVTITCTTPGSANTVFDQANWSVPLIDPQIQASKTGPEIGKAGDDITYTIGCSALNDPQYLGVCTASDDLLGDLGVFNCAAGDSRDFPYTVPGDATGSVDNTVNFICDINDRDNKAEASASHSVTLIDPQIQASKTGPEIGKAGDDITYTIGCSALNDPQYLGVCTASDDLLGDLGVFNCAAGDSRDFPYTVPGDATGSVDNTVNFICDINDRDNKAEASASHSVTLIDPQIQASKTGPEIGKAGDDITYTIGCSALNDPQYLGVCTASDDLLGDLGVFNCAAGDSRDFPYTVPGDATGSVDNTVNFICDINDRDNKAEASASHSVTLIDPQIQASKTGPEIGKAGDDITYTIGCSALNDPQYLGVCTASDDLLGDLGVFNCAAGDSRDFPYTVPGDATGSVDNTVNFICDINDRDNKAEASASHSVTLIDPQIQASKTGPEIGKAGDDITYTIGCSALNDPQYLGVCTASDDLLGDLGVFNCAAGDSRDFPYTVPGDATGSVDNTVKFICDINDRDNKAEASASHSVTLIDPQIQASKTGPEIGKAGDDITYTIGCSALNDPQYLGVCTASDDLLGDLGVFNCAAGDSRDFPYTVPGDATGSVDNTVKFICDINDRDNKAEASASHSVTLIGPQIQASKTGPEIGKAGDDITYTIGCSATNDPQYLGVCTASDDLLGDLGVFNCAAGDSRDFPYTVPGDATGSVDNTVKFICDINDRDNKAEASASHSVTLIDPQIQATKEGPGEAKAGDEITYDIGCSATNDAQYLGVCTANDPLLGGDLGVFDCAAGETRTFSYTVPDDATGSVDNTVKFTCDINDRDNKAEADASWTVDLYKVDGKLTKSCDPLEIPVGDIITWEICVENTGEKEITCDVTDTKAFTGTKQLGPIAPAGKECLTESRPTTVDDVPSITNKAEATCVPPRVDNTFTPEPAEATCEVIKVNEICRTPGFWKSHAGEEKEGRSTNLTQEVIDYAGGSLGYICGVEITDTSTYNYVGTGFGTSNGDESAVEGMCVHPKTKIVRQLMRQLIAASLNCVVSGGGADCTGISVDQDWKDANQACVDEAADMSDWIGVIDDFNNGVSSDCHDRNLKESDVFDDVPYKVPGPAGSSKACNTATKNDFYLVPIP